MPGIPRRAKDMAALLHVPRAVWSWVVLWMCSWSCSLCQSSQENRVSYELVVQMDIAEIRRYPAGLWLTVPVPNDNYAMMLAAGYDMLTEYFQGNNFSNWTSMPMKLPMRISMDMWNMDAPRYASVYLGPNTTELPAAVAPLYFQNEPEGFVYAKRVRSTEDLRIVIHHAACLIADLSMRRAAIDLHQVFIAYHSPNYRTPRSEANGLDEVWVQWAGSDD